MEGGALAAARSGSQQHVTRPYDRRSGDVRPAEWVPHLEAALRYIEAGHPPAIEDAHGVVTFLADRQPWRLDIGAIRRLIVRGRK